MTQTYKQIAKQIALLQKQAEKLRQEEVSEVVARIKETINEYGLTAADLGFSTVRAARGGKAPARGRRGAATAKFKDEHGNTWVGRGPRPAWLREQLAAGKSLEDFLV